MNTSLVNLSRRSLVFGLAGVAILGSAAIFSYARVNSWYREFDSVHTLQRDIDDFMVAKDALMLFGGDPGVMREVRADADDIQAQLTRLAASYPEAVNGVRAIDMIVGVLEGLSEQTPREGIRQVGGDQFAGPAGMPLRVQTLLSNLAAHGVALHGAVSSVADQIEEGIARDVRLLATAFATVSLFFVISGFGTSWIMHRRIAGSVRSLRDTIRQIDSGNAEARAPATAVAEISEVADALNGMVARRRRAEDRLQRSEAMLKLAGDMIRFGGWRYDLGATHVLWTDGTAALHEEPPGHSPSLEEALDYYVEEDRARIAAAVDRCLSEGTPYDQVFRLVTAKGREIRVRTVGQAIRGSEGQITGVRGAIQDVTETFAAREEASKLNTELRTVLGSIGDGFFSLDRNWTFTFANRTGCALLGRDGADLRGLDFWETFPEARGTDFERVFREIMTTGESRSFVESYRPLARWFEVNAHPTPDGLVVYFRDFTSQRAQRERLKLLEAASNHLNDVIVITEAGDVDGPDHPRILYVNDAFERLTGYSSEEAIGNTPRMLQGAGTQPSELARIRRALVARRPVRAELINYRKSGEQIWLEVDVVPLADDSGECRYFVAVMRDISGRKKSLDRVRRSEERFRLATLASNDVIWDWDVESSHFWVSDNYQTVLGHEPPIADRGPAPILSHIMREDREAVVSSLTRALEGTGDSWCAEFRVERADHRVALVKNTAFIMRAESGKAIRVVGGMNDVTELRELDARLHETQKLDSLGELTGGVAHDFNNLLTIILGNADLLDELVEDAQQKRLVDATIQAAQRGAELTSNLLAFSRRQPLAPRPTDVNELIESSRTLFRQGVQAGIDIFYHLAADPPVALIDSSKLQSAVLNLIINSRHAIGERGRITVETGNATLDEEYASRNAEVRPGRYVMISVSDDGEGMSAEVAGRAFEPFFTTKQPGAGTGLGLSSVYGFVKQSGGHARIYSEPGEGTTIRLYLPQTEDREELQAEPAQPVPLQGRGEHILVVEDDPSLRGHVVEMMRAMGYRVSEAGDSNAALEELKRQGNIHLIFTDVVMPGDMNGIALGKLAQELYPGMRVLYTSGYTRDAIVNNGLVDGEVKLLSKPYRSVDLARALREIFS